MTWNKLSLCARQHQPNSSAKSITNAMSIVTECSNGWRVLHTQSTVYWTIECIEHTEILEKRRKHSLRHMSAISLQFLRSSPSFSIKEFSNRCSNRNKVNCIWCERGDGDKMLTKYETNWSFAYDMATMVVHRFTLGIAGVVVIIAFLAFTIAQRRAIVRRYCGVNRRRIVETKTKRQIHIVVIVRGCCTHIHSVCVLLCNTQQRTMPDAEQQKNERERTTGAHRAERRIRVWKFIRKVDNKHKTNEEI